MPDFKPGVNPLFLRDEELRSGIELLYFAWRDFSAAADDLLEEHDLGRAHLRAIYFIGRQPGLVVGDLLDVLGITKQSLSRVLRRLVEDGLVEQTKSNDDRRQRRLYLTPAGKALEEKLTTIQRRQFARAYREAGAEAVEGFRKVLAGLHRG